VTADRHLARREYTAGNPGRFAGTCVRAVPISVIAATAMAR
jgi:hypothetical protein